ncbi:hypothetical protein ZWY2020_002480 [Hordeum vulgare]|nr:hypothetical protein ZWY2020_002480 [Hordeum vulgare]
MPTVTHPRLSMAATAQAAHTQHHHGPVAQIVLFLMVMGFPQHLQVVILKASTICINFTRSYILIRRMICANAWSVFCDFFLFLLCTMLV